MFFIFKCSSLFIRLSPLFPFPESELAWLAEAIEPRYWKKLHAGEPEHVEVQHRHEAPMSVLNISSCKDCHNQMHRALANAMPLGCQGQVFAVAFSDLPSVFRAQQY